MRLIVDGMNVIGSRPDGWWRDRRGAMLKLIDELAGHARSSGDDVTVVLDSRALDVPADAGSAVEVRFAPGGRDAADDVIVDVVAGDSDPSSLVVATSDRRLAARVRALGAETMPSGALRCTLDRRA